MSRKRSGTLKIGLTEQSYGDIHNLIERVSGNICMSRVYLHFKFSHPQTILLIKPVPSWAICLNSLIQPKSRSLDHSFVQQPLPYCQSLIEIDGKMKKILHAMTFFFSVMNVLIKLFRQIDYSKKIITRKSSFYN